MTLGDVQNLLSELQIGFVYLNEIGDAESLVELRGEVEDLLHEWPELERETRALFSSLDALCI